MPGMKPSGLALSLHSDTALFINKLFYAVLINKIWTSYLSYEIPNRKKHPFTRVLFENNFMAGEDGQ